MSQLPRKYAITGNEENLDVITQMLEKKCRAGMSQIRAKNHTLTTLKEVMGSKLTGIVLLNSASYDGSQLGPFQGVHLTSKDAQDTALIKDIKKAGARYIAASCHNEAELEIANSVKCDFVTISPVHIASCHPQATPIGWQRFSQLASIAKMPAFALGGVSVNDLATAQKYGAYGVSGISHFW
ncbi:thiamine phosphate synthase [Vibrio hepatarius]|uniref:thiamine phosphate synthase n=1 Tax=Vibrio hepatarius TaxID=171383 RepID=UPI0020914C90|nr:thiamine phosphate synthase [Vibrio hepatarius]